MSVEMSGHYLGGLGVELKHGPSGATIKTAAPVDNHGDGSSFSPTDMVAASLGACMLTIMAIVGEREGVDLKGTSFSVKKDMTSAPRRIAKLEIQINMPADIPESKRAKIEQAAKTCPVKQSLNSEIEIPIIFKYPS